MADRRIANHIFKERIIMYRSRKRLTLLLLIFLITIMSGAVYAMVIGHLRFTGDITFGQIIGDTELRFTEHTSFAISQNGNGWGRYTIDPTGQIMSFEVYLSAPSDIVRLYYNVINTGTTNAQFTAWSPAPNTFYRRVSGSHSLNSNGLIHRNVVIAPNAIIENCVIEFRWDTNDVTLNESGTILHFDLRLYYEFTDRPATVLP